MDEYISVVVPIFNVEKYLPRCINSIIKQCYEKIEIILVDDGSTDTSGTICDEYKTKDSRIRVFHRTNSGLSASRNFGISVSKYKLICFIDADDYIEKNMLNELKENMDKFNSDISICNYSIINKSKFKRNRNSIIKNKEFSIDGRDKYSYLFNKYGALTTYAWNKLYRKSLFSNINYPIGKNYEDLFIICDILEKAKAISFVTNPLYNYVSRKDSITNSFSLKNFEIVDSLDRIICFCNKNKLDGLLVEAQNRKMSAIISNLSKMKCFKITNNDIEKKYYEELMFISNNIGWKHLNNYNKRYVSLKKVYIIIRALEYKIYYLINRL